MEISRNCQLSRAQIEQMPVMRFDSHSMTAGGKILCLRDFSKAIMQDSKPKRDGRTEYQQNGKTDAYTKLKGQMPVWVLCATHPQGLRGAAHSRDMAANGFITVDLDGISPEHTQRFTDCLKHIPSIAFMARSYSGCGVFCLLYAPDYATLQESRSSRIQNEIYEPLRAWLDEMTGAPFELDEACKDITRLRYESYDAQFYIPEKVTAWEMAPLENAWKTSEIRRFSALFGERNPRPNHANVGAALALMAANARLSVWERSPFDKRKSYNFRIGAVILGNTGEGKGDLINTIHAVASKQNITVGRYGSTANMKNEVVRAANTRGDESDESKGEKTKEITWAPRKVTSQLQSIIELTDEAYSERQQIAKTSYLATKLAERRMLLDKQWKPETTNSSPAPSYAFTAPYQYLCFAPADAYAEAIQGERTDTGDGRRELTFEMPDNDIDVSNVPEGLRGALKSFHAAKTHGEQSADVSQISFILDTMTLNYKARMEQYTTRSMVSESSLDSFPALDWGAPSIDYFRALCLLEASETEARDARTHLANLAAGEAYARGAQTITAHDLWTAAAILRACLGTKRALQDRGDAISQNRRVKILEAYLRSKGEKGVSINGYRTWVSRNLPGEKWVKEWETINTIIEQTDAEARKGNGRIRIATDAEVTANAQAIEISAAICRGAFDMATRLRGQWETQNQTEWARTNRPAYEQETDYAAREIRVYEMINKCNQGGRCGRLVPGQRNSTLHAFKRVLMDNGMWDETARGILESLAIEAGLTEAETRHVLRNEKR